MAEVEKVAQVTKGSCQDNLRGKESTFSRQNRDEDIVSRRDFVHQDGETIIQVLRHGIELLGQVQRDNGNPAASLESHCFLGHAVGGCYDVDNAADL